MIQLHFNKRDFEYDIYSLVKSFFPGKDVTVTCGSEDAAGAELKISVFYEENKIVIKAEELREENVMGCKDTVDLRESAGMIREDFPGICEDAASIRKEGAESQNDGTAAREEAVVVREALLNEPGDRGETKNVLKRLAYQVLRELTGQELPWGNLTGIRPVKLPRTLLEHGKDRDEIVRYMQDTYYTSREKANLAADIAMLERRILDGINYENGYSLYVGIPFCPSICLYCSFSSSPLHIWKNRVDDYLDALCREIDAAAQLFAGKELNTVYIGGGTPTTLEPYQMDRLLTRLEQRFDYRHLKEFTVEAGRPDSITREKLQVLRDHGITRISINPQTMNQKTLDLIGRRHTVEETKEAFILARELGFDNINMDLIVGLPGEGMEEVSHTMQEVCRLAPDSITVHSLALKRATRLNLFKEEYQEISFQNSAQIMDMTADCCREAGLAPYYLYRQKNMAGNFENVGYAAAGKEGIYNILIMEEVQSILALGAGGSTKLVYAADRIERIENVKDIKNYIERIDEMIERKQRINVDMRD